MAATTQSSTYTMFNYGGDEDNDSKKDSGDMAEEPPHKKHKAETKRRTPPLQRLPKYMLEDASGMSQVRYPSRHPNATPGIADYLDTADRSNLRETSNHFSGALPLMRPVRGLQERLGPQGEFCADKKNLTDDEAYYCRSKWPFIAVGLAKELYEKVKHFEGQSFQFMMMVRTEKRQVNVGVHPHMAVRIQGSDSKSTPYTSWTKLQRLLLRIAADDMNPEVVTYKESVRPLSHKITL